MDYHEVIGQLVKHVLQRIKLYTVVILAFSYHFLFEKDLPCTCKNLPRDCSVYMALPFGIILFAQLWMDRACQRGCQCRNCSIVCSRRCFCFVFSRLCSAIFVSSIWPISVLIDGDWKVCCSDHTHHNISCKNDSQRTDEDRAILKDIKDESRVIGLSILLFFFFGAFFASFCHNNSECAQGWDWRVILLEEEEKVLSDGLRTKGKEKLKSKLDEHMNGEEWAKCFNVADELIIEMEAPVQGCANQSNPPLHVPAHVPQDPAGEQVHIQD